MNVQEAMKIEWNSFRLQTPTEEEVFRFTEAMDFLIRETKQPRYMMSLGSYYYESRRFDLALKYYEMAAAYNDINAAICLGYIWYYGRTGERNFEKAFHYYTKGMEAGDLQSAYKIADMFKNGYYVEKDYEKYCEIIEALYPKVRNAMYLNDPLPEIFTRLARIRMEQGKYDEARALLVQAKDFLAQRIADHPFFGDLNIMKWLMEDLNRLPETMRLDENDLYDLFIALKEPAEIRFRYRKKEHTIRSVMEDGACAVCFDEKWYRSVDDFFAKAKINDRLLTNMYQDLYGWKVTGHAHEG